MRITIVALGSRGDVQPYIALGKGLQAAGHQVRLFTHEDFEALVREHGLAFWPAQGNVQAVVESEEMRALLESGNFLAISAKTTKEAQRAALFWAQDGLEACRGADLIIAGIGSLFVALSLAEKLDLPLLRAYYAPFTPTAAFPGVLFSQRWARLGPFANRVTHHLTRQLMWQGARVPDTAAREAVLGIKPAPFWGPYRSARLRRLPILYGFSPAVVPKPADWGPEHIITGYWFLEETEAWSPPPELLAFLAEEPRPLYVGFGSMGNRKPEETADLVLEALAWTGQRAVMLSGWAGLHKENVPESVYLIDAVPHAWLFPRVAAVVHHGGAGTTGAGLRAGVPSIVVPFFADQPFWGERVARLGVGPAPIPRKTVTVARLAGAIAQVAGDERIGRRAAALGRQIRAEDGVAAAVSVVESLDLP